MYKMLTYIRNFYSGFLVSRSPCCEFSRSNHTDSIDQCAVFWNKNLDEFFQWFVGFASHRGWVLPAFGSPDDYVIEGFKIKPKNPTLAGLPRAG